ncbi:hypothetical protein HYC85_012122 [Camellia sinensis]|uniref:Uncharacterized protein n=1 Tax=Camellia sinensis TaxID=4442 RepID=A0A7J7HBL6_CAMSI|nr:hypothetical protein HYC85_012122 [Camellia sinensis]
MVEVEQEANKTTLLGEANPKSSDERTENRKKKRKRYYDRFCLSTEKFKEFTLQPKILWLRWVEFSKRSIAKRVAKMLTGGRERSAFFYDLWNIKYSSKFKWDDLTEEIGMEPYICFIIFL